MWREATIWKGEGVKSLHNSVFLFEKFQEKPFKTPKKKFLSSYAYFYLNFDINENRFLPKYFLKIKYPTTTFEGFKNSQGKRSHIGLKRRFFVEPQFSENRNLKKKHNFNEK